LPDCVHDEHNQRQDNLGPIRGDDGMETRHVTQVLLWPTPAIASRMSVSACTFFNR
jgi:hypothetical protein